MTRRGTPGVHRTLLACTLGMVVGGCTVLDGVRSHPSGSLGGTILWHSGASAFAPGPAFDGTTVYYRSAVDTLTAVDAATGTVRWAVSIGHEASPQATILGCIVAGDVVVCDDLDLVAFRRTDGGLAWHFHTPDDDQGFLSMTAFGSTVYAGSIDVGTVYAIDANSGTELWEHVLFPGDSTQVTAWDPVTDGNIVVAAFTYYDWTNHPRAGAAELDASTGALRWLIYYPPPAQNAANLTRSTALWQNVVLGTASLGTIYALDRATGTVLWTLPGVGNLPPDMGGGPVVGDDRSLVVANSTLFATSNSGWFVAYDLNAEKEAWRVEGRYPGPGGPGGSAQPAVRIPTDGSSVYVVYLSGQINAFSATGPDLEWDVGDWHVPFMICPAVGSDRIFAVRSDGLYALHK